MFSGIAYQLASFDIDVHMLRTMLVSHLEDHPHVNGTHYSTFLSAPVPSNDTHNAHTEAPTTYQQ